MSKSNSNKIRKFIQSYYNSKSIIIKCSEHEDHPTLILEHGHYPSDFMSALKNLVGAKTIGMTSDKFGIRIHFEMPVELF